MSKNNFLMSEDEKKRKVTALIYILAWFILFLIIFVLRLIEISVLFFIFKETLIPIILSVLFFPTVFLGFWITYAKFFSKLNVRVVMTWMKYLGTLLVFSGAGNDIKHIEELGVNPGPPIIITLISWCISLILLSYYFKKKTTQWIKKN